jgi:ureidoacrylate peracid hydrolase
MPTRQILSLEEQLAPRHAALVVVDVQKDYCAADGLLAVRSGLSVAPVRAALPRLNQLIEAARAHDVMVVWVRSAGSITTLQPNHLAVRDDGNGLLAAEGSVGAELDDAVIPPLVDEVTITKRNYDGFHETPLDTVLRARGIESLVMAGVTTNVCVESTARHGYFLGYYIVLASDCSAAPDLTEHDAAVRNIRQYFGKVATRDEIESVWRSASSGVAVEGREHARAH